MGKGLTNMKKNILSAILFFSSTISFGQIPTSDSIKIEYKKLYSFCLDANISSALNLLQSENSGKLSATDQNFKTNFENRFAFTTDKSNYLNQNKSAIDSLYSIFYNYWRLSLLDPSKNYDSSFLFKLNIFLRKSILYTNDTVIKQDSINFYFTKYIKRKQLYATDGVGKTGKLYDLLVWKNEKDTIYNFNLFKEKINARVILMSDFISLGWEDYATLGKHYPGGWATDKALYCVSKAYDIKSEKFLISYLAHESRHFKDYKLFPKLKSADLEYRAKLTELSLANKTLYNLIQFFISNANYQSESGHSIANYCVIRDLSKKIFKKDFESDITKWKASSIKKINKTAYSVLKRNTKLLSKNGKTIQSYIK